MNTDRNGILNLNTAPAAFEQEYGRYTPPVERPERRTGPTKDESMAALRGKTERQQVEIEVLKEELRLAGTVYDPNTKVNQLRRGYYKMQARLNQALALLRDQETHDTALETCESERRAADARIAVLEARVAELEAK